MRSKIVWMILTFGCVVSSGWGQLLFEESFTQSSTVEDSEKVKSVKENLNYKFHQEKGGSILIKDYDHGLRYKIPEKVEDHDTVYISFCLRSKNSVTKDKFSGLMFYQDGQEVFGLGNDYFSEFFAYWPTGGKGSTIGEIPTLVDLQPHQIIMRVDYHENGPEKIKIWLDPFCNRSEIRQPDRIVTELEHDLAFDEMRLRCGNQDCAWQFDEIRIGSSWESVTPSDDNPGDVISKIIKNSTPAANTEMIGEGIARFYPDDIESATVLPSFALEKPRETTGPLSSSWQLKPRFSSSKDQRHVYFDIGAEVDLYGTGEVTGSLLRNGSKIILFNKDNYGYGKPDQLYQAHPWVLGLRKDGSAFGIIFDTPWKAELDLRSGILFTTRADAPDFPVIIIEGKTPQQVMIKLSDLTGHMPMPPRWSLGYQQCRYSYNPDARVREIVDTFRAKQIPCDVLWFDIDYMDGFRVFTVDPNQFPDPEGINQHLHSLGFKSVWMIDPGVKHDPGYFVFDSGTQADIWVNDASGKSYIGPVWPGDCVFPDFTMPRTRQWWAGLYKNFIRLGIDGIWNDMNEPAVFKEETKWTMPLDNRHRGGGDLPPGPHIQYHNVYGLLMVKATREGILAVRPQKRPFVLSRANFLGGHRYAATWTGDNNATWQHLKWSIPMSLNLSLSGQPFNGPDIGGFVGNATPELWAHWISIGAFYPFSRAHSAKGTDDQEPWSFGQETETAARIALQRRYRLMPYLYTLFRQSHLNGLPIMQPVFFADPDDEKLRTEDRAFLVGQDLMVIPKWAKDVQIPKGIWQSISLVDKDTQADPYQCDVKVRGGSIVPLGPVIQCTEQINDGTPLTLVIVLDEQGQAEGTLYEDSGEGYGYLNDQFCLSTFNARKQGSNVIVECAEQTGSLSKNKRLVAVEVIDKEGIRYGFGDICGGVTVMLSGDAEMKAEINSLK